MPPIKTFLSKNLLIYFKLAKSVFAESIISKPAKPRETQNRLKTFLCIAKFGKVCSFGFCVVMGPGQKFLTRVESGQPFMVWV